MSPQVHLWLAAVDASTASETPLEPEELSRAAAFHAPLDAERFRARRRWLRSTLASHLGVGRESPGSLSAHYVCPECGINSSHGRPGYLVDGVAAPVTLSLTHHDHWVALALMERDGGGGGEAGADIGLDLAPVLEPSEEFRALILTPAERHAVAQQPAGAQPRLTALVWAAKEATLKARATGLRTPPSSVDVLDPAARLRPGLVDLSAHAPQGHVLVLAQPHVSGPSDAARETTEVLFHTATD